MREERMKRRTLLVSGAAVLATSIAGCTGTTDSTPVSGDTSAEDVLNDSSVFQNVDYLDSTIIVTTDQYPHVNDMGSQTVEYLNVAAPSGREVGRAEVHFGVTEYRFPIETIESGSYRAVGTFADEDGAVSAEALIFEVGVGGVTITGFETYD